MLPGTWRLAEVTVVGGSEHPIPIQENVTFEVDEPPSPRASVSWTKSQTLEIGESFEFDSVLKRSRRATTLAVSASGFEVIKPDSQQTLPALNGYLSD